MAQQRDQFAVVVAHQPLALAGCGFLTSTSWPGRRTPAGGWRIALHERCVAGPPARARAQVPQQVEHERRRTDSGGCRCADRPGRCRCPAACTRPDALPALPNRWWRAAGRCDRRSCLRDLAHDRLQAGVVLVAPLAVGLDHQRAFAHDRSALRSTCTYAALAAIATAKCPRPVRAPSPGRRNGSFRSPSAASREMESRMPNIAKLASSAVRP